MSIWHASKGRRLFKYERAVIAAMFVIWGVGPLAHGDWRELLALGTACSWWVYACLLEHRLWGEEQ